jgi:hypothetical protein
MKEGYDKDMESLKEKKMEIPEIKCFLNQLKNVVESHSSRLEQEENRISGLKDNIYIYVCIYEKTEEPLGKRVKNSVIPLKDPNLRIMGTDELWVQPKGTCNLLNKIIAENYSNLKKEKPIQV